MGTIVWVEMVSIWGLAVLITIMDTAMWRR